MDLVVVEENLAGDRGQLAILVRTMKHATLQSTCAVDAEFLGLRDYLGEGGRVLARQEHAARGPREFVPERVVVVIRVGQTTAVATMSRPANINMIRS